MTTLKNSPIKNLILLVGLLSIFVVLDILSPAEDTHSQNFKDLITKTVVFLLVLSLAAMAVVFVSRKKNEVSIPSVMKKKSSLALTSKHQLHVIEISGKSYVFGTSEGAMYLFNNIPIHNQDNMEE